MPRSIAAVLFPILFLFVPSAQTRPQQHRGQMTVAELVKRSHGAVAQVVVLDQRAHEISLGTGFIVSADGKVVTIWRASMTRSRRTSGRIEQLTTLRLNRTITTARNSQPSSVAICVASPTLSVQLTLTLAGCVEDFHLKVNAPCRAHQTNAGAGEPTPASVSQLSVTSLAET